MHAEHEVTVAAPARIIYDIVADITRWPYTFAPTIHAEQLSFADGVERIRLWALANGEVKSWTSRRELDADTLRVAFRQEVSAPPVAAMSGEWVLQPLSPDKTRVVLTHDYRAADDAPENRDWVDRAVDRNSRAELAALAAAAESAGELAERLLDFTDTVTVAAPVEPIYDFLYRADRWPERLPHVARLELAEDVPGYQVMEMDTRTATGAVHTTRSVRIGFAPDRIVYKQIAVPALMSAHIGEWRLTAGAAEVAASSRHQVVINPDTVASVLGPEATVSDAREFVRKALSTNSRVTLNAAKDHAEGLR